MTQIARRKRVPLPPGYLRNEGADYQAQGEYTGAERCFRDAVALLEEAPGFHGEELGCLLNDLADALYAQGKYGSATEALYGRALESLERINGRDHPDVANVLNNLASRAQEAHGRGARLQRPRPELTRDRAAGVGEWEGEARPNRTLDI